jgi:hypothetical protein
MRTLRTFKLGDSAIRPPFLALRGFVFFKAFESFRSTKRRPETR